MSKPRRLSPAEISDLQQDMFDRDFYNAVLEEQRYAFGGGDSFAVGTGDFGDMPISPDVTSFYNKVGKVRMSMQAAMVAQSRVMSIEPEPGWTGLDEINVEVRKKWWHYRYHGMGGGDPWGQAIQDAWMDGRQHGVGALESGLETNRETGLQRVTVGHVPALQVLWDPAARDPRRSRYAAVVKFLPFAVACARYGREHCERHKREEVANSGRGAKLMPYVPVTEFWSREFGDAEPTMAVTIGGLNNKPMRVRRNEFGGIPLAWMVHFLAPGMRKPIGQVALQRSAEEQIGDIIEYLKEVLATAPGMTMMRTDLLNPEQLERWREGAEISIFELDGDPGGLPAWHIPGPQVDSSAVKLLEMMMQEFGRMSGLSEIDRGGTLQGDKTKFEIAQMQNAVSQNMSGTTFQTVRFLREAMTKVFDIAKRFDRDPFEVTVKGEIIAMNDPEDLNSQISAWLREPAQLVLTAESLTSQDDEAKRMRRMAQLERMAPYIGQLYHPFQFATEFLRTLGIQDVDKWLMQSGDAAIARGANPQAVGQIVQGLQGAGAPGAAQGV